MRIGPYHEVARQYQSHLGKEGMLDAHPADFKIILYTVLPGKVREHLAVVRAPHVLGGRKVVRHEHYLFLVENFFGAYLFKLFDSERSGDIIAEAEIDPHVD